MQSELLGIASLTCETATQRRETKFVVGLKAANAFAEHFKVGGE